MQQTIQQKVKSILISVLSLDENTIINSDTQLKDDLGLDSMSSLTFLMNLEEAITGFTVDPETLEMKHLETVGSITQYITEQLLSVNHKASSQVIYA